MKRKNVSAGLQNAAQHVAKRHGLLLIISYGSYVRGTQTHTSDIDIAVLGRVPLSPEDEAVVAEDLARESHLPNIEVKSLHRVSPLFMDTVLTEGIVLYEGERDLARALSLYAWKLACESKFLRDARYQRSRKRLHV